MSYNTTNVRTPVAGTAPTKTQDLLEALAATLVEQPIGSRFVSDREVCRRFDVSPGVARSALTTLVEQGLIRRVPGRGTFIESHTPRQTQSRPFKIVVFYYIERNSPHSEAVRSIAQALRPGRHDLVTRDNEFLCGGHDINRMALLIDEALSEADGVMWISACSEEEPVIPELLRGREDRLVFVNLLLHDRSTTCVMRDDRQGTRAITEHLIALGHRRIAYLGGPEKRAICRWRYKGFRDAMRSAGLPLDTPWQMPFLDALTYETGQAGMLELLRMPERPTACVCAVDTIAFGAMAPLEEAGLSVPEDMALTGFDNSEHASTPARLTSADPAFDEIGRQAALHLLGQIEQKARPGTTLHVPCPIVIRGSTVKNCS